MPKIAIKNLHNLLAPLDSPLDVVFGDMNTIKRGSSCLMSYSRGGNCTHIPDACRVIVSTTLAFKAERVSSENTVICSTLSEM